LSTLPGSTWDRLSTRRRLTKHPAPHLAPGTAPGT